MLDLGLELSTNWLIALLIVAFVAGWVDAIAGGGGLLVLPTLLSAGVPPVQALATNKLQGTAGTLTSSLNFLRRGQIEWREIWLPFVLSLAGSAAGTWVVQWVDASQLAALLPLLLIGFAVYFVFSPDVGDVERQARVAMPVFGLTVGFGVGFYDGFFGPGTGAFFALGFVALAGFSLRKATAGAKLLNFASNIASLLVFAVGGHMLWALGLSMAAAQMVGAFWGSQHAIKHGTKLIRPLLVLVSVGISIRLLLVSLPE